MNSSLEKLVKSLSDNDSKYLSEEFGSENLELFKQKDTCAYEYMDSFKRFGEETLPDQKRFYSSVKDGTTGDNGKKLDGHINDEDYLMSGKIWVLLRSLFEKRYFVIIFLKSLLPHASNFMGLILVIILVLLH